MNEMNRIPETCVAVDTMDELTNSLRGDAQTAAPTASSANTTIVPPDSSADAAQEDIKVIPKSKLAVDSVGELMNDQIGHTQPDIPTFNPGNSAEEDAKVIPKSKLAVETEAARQKAALKRLRDAWRSNKPMVIRPDGSLGVLDNHKKADPDAKTIPKSKLAVDSVGELLNSQLGRNQSDIPTFNPGNSAAEDAKVIPPSKLAAPQWYETNPTLCQAEIAAWRKEMKNPNLQPKFMSDGRMYWLVKCRPNIDIDGVKFDTLEYTMAGVYDANHPSCGYGSSVKWYLLDPTLTQLEDAIKQIPGLEPKYIPHTIRDNAGNRYLCTSRVSDTSDNINHGITSAVTSYRFAYNWLTKFEGAIRDPEGLWKDFHEHGKI